MLGEKNQDKIPANVTVNAPPPKKYILYIKKKISQHLPHFKYLNIPGSGFLCFMALHRVCEDRLFSFDFLPWVFDDSPLKSLGRLLSLTK